MKGVHGPVLTKAQQLQGSKPSAASAFQVIDFSDDPQLTTKCDRFDEGQGPSLPKTRTLLNKGSKEFNIKQARHEVIRFAINNQRQTKNKKKLEIQQLVRLGAKPPRKPHRNYKELLVERKNLSKIREQRKELHQLGKTSKGMAAVNCRNKTKNKGQQWAPVTAIDRNYGVVKSIKTAKRKGK